MKKFVILLIKLYQLCLSPFIGAQCRFFPSCSEFAKEAIEKEGVLRGTWRFLKRIVKCGPWHPGGCDPV